MIKIIDKKQCCACEACVQICPKKCIDMKIDAEGFQYPDVNKQICINCRLCEKVCPVQNATKKGDSVYNTYVAYAKDEEMRLKSSSGGIFTVLAEKILRDNGVIFGAVYDADMMVHHMSIDNINDLYTMRGSKYLQSRIENTYDETRRMLEDNKPVLYTGTGCQIAGLKRYLKKEYDTLYTVDILCHGVPSPKVWNKYLREKEREYKSSISEASFREKNSGWLNYSILLRFDNSEIYEKIFSDDQYMQLFLQNISLRPSCYDCKFKNLERYSDLTIGDCWGIQNYMPQMYDDKGTSVVLVHSMKGKELWNFISKDVIFCEAETDKALPITADSRKSVISHKNRNKFFKVLDKWNFNKLAKLVKPLFFNKFYKHSFFLTKFLNYLIIFK